MKGQHSVFIFCVMIFMVCNGEMFPGGRIFPGHPEFLHTGTRVNQEPVPVPLPLPAQSGYIILPKANFAFPKINIPQNGKPNHPHPPLPPPPVRNGPVRNQIPNNRPNNVRPQLPPFLDKPTNVRPNLPNDHPHGKIQHVPQPGLTRPQRPHGDHVDPRVPPVQHNEIVHHTPPHAVHQLSKVKPYNDLPGGSSIAETSIIRHVIESGPPLPPPPTVHQQESEERPPNVPHLPPVAAAASQDDFSYGIPLPRPGNQEGQEVVEFDHQIRLSNQILQVSPEDRKPIFSHQVLDHEISLPESNHQSELHSEEDSNQRNHESSEHGFRFPDFAEPEPSPILIPVHSQQVHSQQAHSQQAHSQQAHSQQVHSQQAHSQQVHSQQAHSQQVHAQQVHSQPSHAHSVLHAALSSEDQEHQKNDFQKPRVQGSYEHSLSEESAPISHYGQVLPPDDATYSSEINNFPGLQEIPNNEPWPLPMPEMPKIVHLDVKCEKNLMKIAIDFDKPFHGIIYSKGHYSYGRCVHLPSGSGHHSVHFDISVNSCGMQGNSASGIYGPTETGSYFENTIVVQYDPLVQEVWDQARKLRCNWHDQYEKTVTFRPFPVDMLQVVRADFAGDNVGCWMQIQVGKGPWASEVAGIVRIGQTMTLVLAIKDDENRFDMLVRNCIAHDGNRAPIELVDSSGCVMRPKLMSRFTKVKNFGSSASVLSYAHFQAFKFPDSTDVHIQCTVQICRHQCEDQCSSHHIRKRDAGSESTEVGLNKIIQVISSSDLTFSPDAAEARSLEVTEEDHRMDGNICMSASGLAATLILLLSVVIISCILATFLYLRQRTIDELPLPYDLKVFKKHSSNSKKPSEKHKTTDQKKH